MDIMTMKYTIVWCAIVIGCWAVNSANSSPPQCFKLKFGEISCNQAVDANTILKTTSSDCFQSQKGAKVLEILHKNTNQMEQITKYIKSHNSDCGKYKKMYDEGKAEINKLTKTVQTCNVKVSTLEKKLKQKEKEKPIKITRTHYSLAKLRRCGSGIQNTNVIRNSQFSSSGTLYGHQVYDCRLLTSKVGWRGKSNTNVNQWIQVDFLQNRKFTGVATQGYYHPSYWVTNYRVLYREASSNKWKCIRSASGGCVNFKGNTDYKTTVVNEFGKHIKARYWRINPRAWNVYPIIRFDLMSC